MMKNTEFQVGRHRYKVSWKRISAYLNARSLSRTSLQKLTLGLLDPALNKDKF